MRMGYAGRNSETESVVEQRVNPDSSTSATVDCYFV